MSLHKLYMEELDKNPEKYEALLSSRGLYNIREMSSRQVNYIFIQSPKVRRALDKELRISFGTIKRSF